MQVSCDPGMASDALAAGAILNPPWRVSLCMLRTCVRFISDLFIGSLLLAAPYLSFLVFVLYFYFSFCLASVFMLSSKLCNVPGRYFSDIFRSSRPRA